MLKEKKKWMRYTYFHRNPTFHWRTAHLFSPVKKKISGMVRVPFPTMICDIRMVDFVSTWSSSTRTKINRATNEPLVISRGRELLADILSLFGGTARRKKLRGHLLSDFDSRPWLICSAVYFENKILAGHVWIMDEEERRALLYVNATNQQNSSLDPSLIGRAHYYLLWQDGVYFRDIGIDQMDLHGYDPQGEGKLEGAYRWKEGTHGSREEMYNYYPFWFYWIQRIRKQISA